MVSLLSGIFSSVKNKAFELVATASSAIAGAAALISSSNNQMANPLSHERVGPPQEDAVRAVELDRQPRVYLKREEKPDLGFNQNEIDAAIQASLQPEKPDEDPFDLAVQLRNPAPRKEKKVAGKRKRAEPPAELDEKHFSKEVAAKKPLIEEENFGLNKEELALQQKMLKNFGEPAQDAILIDEIPEGRRVVIDGQKQHIVSFIKGLLSKDTPINPFTYIAPSHEGMQNLCAMLNLEPADFTEIWTHALINKEEIESMIHKSMDESARSDPQFIELSTRIEDARRAGNQDLHEELSDKQLTFLKENDEKIKDQVDRFMTQWREDAFLTLVKNRVKADLYQEFAEAFGR